jgi:hypothetical protein
MLKIDRRKVERARRAIVAWHSRRATGNGTMGLRALAENPVMRSLVRARVARAGVSMLAPRGRGTRLGMQTGLYPAYESPRYDDPEYWATMASIVESSKETLSSTASTLQTVWEMLPSITARTYIQDAAHYAELGAEQLGYAVEDLRYEELMSTVPGRRRTELRRAYPGWGTEDRIVKERERRKKRREGGVGIKIR